MEAFYCVRKRVFSFLMAICLLLVMAPASALAVARSATMIVGESASFQHYSHYGTQSKYTWEITSGSNCVKITSGANSDTCTVEGTAVGTAILKGTASRSGYSRTYNYYHTVTLTVNPRNTVMTFDANGGSVSTTSVSIYDGCTLGRMPTPIRSGYTFQGWFTQKSGGTQYKEGDTITVAASSPFNVYAHWKRGNTTSPVKSSSPEENTANVTIDGTKYTFYLGKTYADTSHSQFTFYTLRNGELEKSIMLTINNQQDMWETVNTNDKDTRLKSLTISYKDKYTDSKSYSSAKSYSYGSISSGNNIMTLDLKSDDGKHFEGTFSGDVRMRDSNGAHEISGSFNATYGQSHTKVPEFTPTPTPSHIDTPTPRPTATYDDDPFCSTCNGTGDCPKCYGIGWDICNSCYMGRCKICGGDGEIMNYKGEKRKCTSSNCNRGACKKCGGTNRIDCSRCHGSGDCPTCHNVNGGLKPGRTL